MLGYVARRGVYTLIVILIASIVIFVGLRITPGDPTLTLFNPFASEKAKDLLRMKFGLDRPIVVQYLLFLRELLHGDLGNSIRTGQPVTKLIVSYGKNSLILIGAATLLTYGLAIPLGVVSAIKHNTWIDHVVSGFTSLAMGVPNFLLGLLLILFVGVKLHWLPISGTGGVSNLVLPAVTLSGESLAVATRLMRSSMLEQLGQEYVRTLRAKGLSARTIVWKHALRNAIIPLISLSALQVGALVGYTTIVELVFRWPGLGYLLVNSVLSRDYPVALALALVLTTSVVLANFGANVGYALADPRIRSATRRAL